MNLALPILLPALCLGAAPPDPGTEMRIRVVDEGRRPVAGASVRASIWGQRAVDTRGYTTDADGVAVVGRPGFVRLMRVWVSKEGHAGLFRGWERGTHDEGRDLPATFTFVLPRAVTAGGKVVDADGRPVAGARLEARCEVDGAKPLPDGVAVSTTLAYGSGAVVTGKDGRWRLDNVPASVTAISLRVAHPDFVSDDDYGELQKSQRVTLAQLRSGEAVIRLRPGARIEGTVTDAAGKPVPRAVVVFHHSPYGTPGDWEVLTDRDGKYRLPTLKPGRHPITVVAEGHMPQMREVEAAVGPRREDFRLEPGKRLRVRVVDEDGKPVKAYFSIAFWRGKRSLYNHRHPNVLNPPIPTGTNAEGVYEWPWAPADVVKYNVSAEGLLAQTCDLTASEDIQTVTLRRMKTITGRVTDARTGKAVEQFRVHPVLQFGPNNLHVERRYAVRGAAGAYRVVLDRGDVDYRLMVEADGYRTAVSRPSLVAERAKVVDFKLEPADPVRGRVLGAGGRPVAKASVSLATAVQGYLNDDAESNLSTLTDEKGGFSLPAQAERFALVVSHDQGSALLERRPGQPVGDVTLRPWASVRGVLWQDGKPVPEQTVFLQPLTRHGDDAPRLQFDYQMQTDADGAYSFPRVPAGPLTVHAYLGPWGPSPLTSSESVAVDARPGEAVRLDLGKSGATLVGKLKLTGDVPKGLDWTYSLNWLTRRTPDVKVPADWNPRGIDLREDGRPTLGFEEYLVTHRRFFIKPTPAGRFRVVGVPAGEYWLSIQVYEKPDG